MWWISKVQNSEDADLPQRFSEQKKPHCTYENICTLEKQAYKTTQIAANL